MKHIYRQARALLRDDSTMSHMYRLALLLLLVWIFGFAWQTRHARQAAIAAANAEAAAVRMQLPTFAPAPAPDTTALAALGCPVLPAHGADGTPQPSRSSVSSGNAMYHRPPDTLQTLDILRVGLSLDALRQGQLWTQLQQQNAGQPAALQNGPALSLPSQDPLVDATDKNTDWDQRRYDALELALKEFPQRWPLPTVTVVRDYGSAMARPRAEPEDMAKSLPLMAGRDLEAAGLPWHQIRQLAPGVVCRTDPEALVESIFLMFDRNPDLPALMVYAIDGPDMRAALAGQDPPQDGMASAEAPAHAAPTDAVVALVVGRPERTHWLYGFAHFTSNWPGSADPKLIGLKESPLTPFQPSPFFAAPLTEQGLRQWEPLRPLARLHRPVTIPLVQPVQPGQHGKPLNDAARQQALASGWNQATQHLGEAPARVFFDGGENDDGLAQLASALSQASHPVDLRDASQSYDLQQRLGDTGAASPFVGMALATMASYLNADSSLVVPLRQPGRATFIGISSTTPGHRPDEQPFAITPRPQAIPEPEPERLTWVAWLRKQYREIQKELVAP